jgi:hypothetical protein
MFHLHAEAMKLKMQAYRYFLAAGWLLCAPVLCVISTLGQESKQPDLSGMSIEDLAKLKVDAVYWRISSAVFPAST